MKTVTAAPPWQLQCEALYREHSARVKNLCRLLLDDPQEAQEVAQDVFLKLVRSYQAVDRPAEWGPWLTRVAVNACRDRRRSGWWRWWRQRGVAIEDVEVVDREATPEQAALSRETRERIWHGFLQLPSRQREVLVLRYLEGYSFPEMASALGVTTGSVKRHLFRAVQRLRKVLGGES